MMCSVSRHAPRRLTRADLRRPKLDDHVVHAGPRDGAEQQQRECRHDAGPGSGARLAPGDQRPRQRGGDGQARDARARARHDERHAHHEKRKRAQRHEAAFLRHGETSRMAGAGRRVEPRALERAVAEAEHERQRHEHPARVVIGIDERSERRGHVLRPPEAVDQRELARIGIDRQLDDGQHRDQDAEEHHGHGQRTRAHVRDRAGRAEQEQRKGAEEAKAEHGFRRIDRDGPPRQARRVDEVGGLGVVRGPHVAEVRLTEERVSCGAEARQRSPRQRHELQGDGKRDRHQADGQSRARRLAVPPGDRGRPRQPQRRQWPASCTPRDRRPRRPARPRPARGRLPPAGVF